MCFRSRQFARIATLASLALWGLGAGWNSLAWAEPPLAAAGDSTLAITKPPLPLPAGDAKALELARRVTIYRDSFGVAHIDGADDQSTLFGFAYAQAEDYFWQIEDSYILSLGRYSELIGPKGLNSDLLNRSFQIVPQAQAAFGRLDPETRSLYESFAAGLNYYLAKHPNVKPRMLERFEPWHVLAYGRHMLLEIGFRYTRLSHNYMPRSNDLIWPATGSNGWALGPSKTASGRAMLFVNPHLPWFGFGQMYEAHLRSGSGWSFTGATMFGNPALIVGHNEHLGWTLTTNEPDIADVWRVTFDDPAEPLNYRYGDGYRTATEWQETIRIKSGDRHSERKFTLRKTHHGPCVVREDDQHYLAARIAGLYESIMLRQSMRLMRAKNQGEFRAGLALQQFPLMNLIYADCDGNISFLYNGIIPRRDPQFTWNQPVDGSDPRTEWNGIHSLGDLPQVINPPSGYVQNCNSTPFTTCDQGCPDRQAFPRYMIEDHDDDKNRAKISRQLLGAMENVTFEDLQRSAFDTTVYWAQQEIPKLVQGFARLETDNPVLARQVRPYVEHLAEWDCRITAASTHATLCEAWYEEIFGANYAAEKLPEAYREKPELVFQALLQAVGKLMAMHRSWRVPWGDVFRIQRRENIADFLHLPFDDSLPSVPSLGAPGPMGVVFTQYSSPYLRIPFFRTLKKRYGMIGPSYLAVYEFGHKVRGSSVLNFGVSGDPKSPHFFDQAQLLSQCQLKPELFYWDDVAAGARRVYHPGQ